MLTGLLLRRWCKSPKAFVYDKFAERKPGLDKGQGLLTLHDSTPPYYPLCTTEGIKAPFKNKVMGLAHRSFVFPCHSFFPFLSFSLSFSGWLFGAQRLSLFSLCVQPEKERETETVRDTQRWRDRETGDGERQKNREKERQRKRQTDRHARTQNCIVLRISIYLRREGRWRWRGGAGPAPLT